MRTLRELASEADEILRQNPRIVVDIGGLEKEDITYFQNALGDRYDIKQEAVLSRNSPLTYAVQVSCF